MYKTLHKSEISTPLAKFVEKIVEIYGVLLSSFSQFIYSRYRQVFSVALSMELPQPRVYMRYW